MGNRKRRVFIFVFIALLVVAVSFTQARSFEVSSGLFKVSLNEDSSAIRTFTISSEEGGQFNVQLSQINGISLSENEFVLEKGGSKEVNLDFSSYGVSPGVYAGNVKISSSGQEVAIPIVFEVESKDLLFDSNLDIPTQYQKILPSGKIVAQIKVYDLTSSLTSEGLGNPKVDVDYKVYSVETGNEISMDSMDSESIVVNKMTQMTKTVSFSQGIKEGNYVFSVIVKYKGTVGVSSYLFEVSKDVSSPGAGGDDSGSSLAGWAFISILILIFFLFLAMVFLFIYLLKDRDKLVADMRKYNNLELKRQKALLLEQARLIRKNKLASAERVRKDIGERIKRLKKEHSCRIKELNKLKDKGKVKEMTKRISRWKSEGYNVAPLQYKMDSLSKREMNNIMSKWKEKGYKLT